MDRHLAVHICKFLQVLYLLKIAMQELHNVHSLLRYLADDRSLALHEQIAQQTAGAPCEALAQDQLSACKAFLAQLDASSPDAAFMRWIAAFGPHGELIAEHLAGWRSEQPHSLWIDPSLPSPHCRALLLLSEVLWKDKIQPFLTKSREQVPAMTLSVQRPLNRLLSSRAALLEEGPAMSFEGTIIAALGPTDPTLLPLITAGLKHFSSIYHHKLLRLLCQLGFNRWVHNVPDPQILRFEGGETEIAKELALKFKAAPSILRSLLYAQAYMKFSFDDASRASLISLRHVRSMATRRLDALEIVLNTQLMPSYTFQTDRRGRLLVPIPDFPTFVSAPQYHAGQALLQNLVMEEFTHRSMELFTSRSIIISPERWQDLFYQSGLPVSVFKQTFARWIADELFLRPVAAHRYTLGSACGQELEFLLTQGARRTERQRQGRLSVRKRRLLA